MLVPSILHCIVPVPHHLPHLSPTSLLYLSPPLSPTCLPPPPTLSPTSLRPPQVKELKAAVKEAKKDLRKYDKDDIEALEAQIAEAYALLAGGDGPKRGTTGAPAVPRKLSSKSASGTPPSACLEMRPLCGGLLTSRRTNPRPPNLSRNSGTYGVEADHEGQIASKMADSETSKILTQAKTLMAEMSASKGGLLPTKAKDVEAALETEAKEIEKEEKVSSVAPRPSLSHLLPPRSLWLTVDFTVPPFLIPRCGRPRRRSSRRRRRP